MVKNKRKDGTTGRWTRKFSIQFTTSQQKSRYTSNRRYAIRIKEDKQRKKRKKTKAVRGRDRHLVSGQSSRRQSHMRTHETRRGNSHIGWSSKAIEFSWWGRGRWCIRGDTGCQLFEGR